jgi:hypothetical protein
MQRPTWLLVCGLLLGATPASRADVDLVTIPTREGTQLTIYNSEDITMVREHRLQHDGFRAYEADRPQRLHRSLSLHRVG